MAPVVVALALSSLPQAALAARPGNERVSEALRALERASTEPLHVVRSRLTDLATFVATKPGHAIPLDKPEAVTPEDRAFAFLASYGDAFAIEDRSQARVLRIDPDDLGMHHVRLQQHKDGVPVTGGELIVHLAGDQVVAVNGRTLPRLERVDTRPTLEATEAVRAAATFFAPKHEMRDVTLSPPRLEILNRGLLEGSFYPTRLAWFVEAKGFAVRWFLWIDARSGEVLLDFSQLTNALSRSIYTANNSSTLPGTLVRSEGGPATGDPDADLAYVYSGHTYDYYLTQHGRDSYDGAGAPLVSSVHFCDQFGCPFQNAFWNGLINQMVYGEDFSLADDVDAHELTHAVTEHSANLFYYMQSGALNESYSDIFGETVDLTNGAGNDSSGVRWRIAEDLPGFGALRNMMDPIMFGDPGKMTDPQFFCEDDGLFGDAGGIHTNSGVPNHAYALMVDGGSYNGVTVSGIGLTKAGKIEYRALTLYLGSASDFLDNYNALKQSCVDLIGTAGISAADCTEVGKALDAVQMANTWPCAPVQAAVPAVCPAGQAPNPLFSDDLENPSSGKWATQNLTGINHWNGGDGSPPGDLYFPLFATSGVYSFWGFDYEVIGDSTAAMTSSLTLPPSARMQFNHAYGFENFFSRFFDGGVIEYSTNNGASWNSAGSLISAGAAYGGVIDNGFGNPLGGRNAFVGESWGYTATQLNLASLSGSNVRFRFRMGTDESVDDYGWFVDDVRVYTCGSPNLAVTKTDGRTTVDAGTMTTYTIVASNAGPVPATGATVVDTFPAAILGVSWTCAASSGSSCSTASGTGNINRTVNLAVGGSVTFTAVATVSPTATGMLSNTATVSPPAGVVDPVPGNNSATDTDTIVPIANLSITKTNGQTTASPSTPVTYTIVASNAGPNATTGATVMDTVPAALTGVGWTCVGAAGGTCPANGSGNINASVNLPVGGSVTFTLSGTVSANPSGLVNTATVSVPAGMADPNLSNNSETDEDLLLCFGERVVVADGRVTQDVIGASSTTWFLSRLRSGSSYSLEFKNTTGGSSEPGTLTVFSGADGCSGTSTLSVLDTVGIEPAGAAGSRRVSFTAGSTGSYFRARLVNGAGSPIGYSVSWSETTLYSAAWSTIGSFDTFYSFQNTTSATVSGTLTALDTAGAVISSFPVTVPAGQTTSMNTQALGVVRNKTGTARFSHDGPPGAIQVEAAIANFTLSPAYIQPVRFQTVREAR